MAAYVGDAVAVLVTVQDPFTNAALPDYTVAGDVYYGLGNPRTTPALRGSPQVANVEFLWSVSHAGYLGYIDTTGFPAGLIYLRVRVTGPVFNNVEFGSFRLSA